jgi:hypothetical protein
MQNSLLQASLHASSPEILPISERRELFSDTTSDAATDFRSDTSCRTRGYPAMGSPTVPSLIKQIRILVQTHHGPTGRQIGRKEKRDSVFRNASSRTDEAGEVLKNTLVPDIIKNKTGEK